MSGERNALLGRQLYNNPIEGRGAGVGRVRGKSEMPKGGGVTEEPCFGPIKDLGGFGGSVKVHEFKGPPGSGAGGGKTA